MPRGARPATAAALAVVVLAQPAPGLGAPAHADSAVRVQLPDPTPAGTVGTTAPLDASQQLSLRVYLTGQPGRAVAALAVSDPRGPGYAHYLTVAQFQQQYGPSAAQTADVGGWLASQGLAVTGSNAHYIAVTGTVAHIDAAFDTQVSVYSQTVTVTIHGQPFPVTITAVGTVGGFSVPASLGSEVAMVTGIEETPAPASPAAASLFLAFHHAFTVIR